MPISWMSRQGQRTRTNNDAAAAGHKDHYLLAMLVDAADKGSNGQGLAQHWAHTIVRAALSGNQPPDITSITQLMREQQRELRHHYLHEIASYCCVLIDLQSRQLHILHTGDCLVGTQQANSRIDWITTPHTLSNQLPYAQMPPATVPAEQRHLLTRSLNARCFCSPDSYATVLEPAASLLLCTDGYWYEHLKQGVDLQQLQDDASVLSLTLGEPTNRQQTDCDNFSIIAPSPADSLPRSQQAARLESELATTPVDKPKLP